MACNPFDPHEPGGCPKSDLKYLIALGGNLPVGEAAPIDTLRAALARLAELGVQVEAVSGFYETPCFPAGAGPDYVNAAARLSSGLTPHELLDLLHQVEAEFGRARQQRWGMRTLDLDLIAAGTTVLPDQETLTRWMDLPLDAQKTRAPDRLILPHPRLQDRAFVLVPLADVALSWRHPVAGLDVAQMLARIDPAEIAQVRRILA